MQKLPFLLVFLHILKPYMKVMKHCIITLIFLQSFILSWCFEKKELESETLTPVQEVSTEWTIVEEEIPMNEPELSDSTSDLPASVDSSEESQTEVSETPQEETQTDLVPSQSPENESPIDSDTGNSASTEGETETKTEIIAEYEDDLEALFDDLLWDEE